MVYGVWFMDLLKFNNFNSKHYLLQADQTVIGG
jgi:hypothetical protein